MAFQVFQIDRGGSTEHEAAAGRERVAKSRVIRIGDLNGAQLIVPQFGPNWKPRGPNLGRSGDNGGRTCAQAESIAAQSVEKCIRHIANNLILAGGTK